MSTPLQSTAPAAEPASIAGRYRVERKLAEGGMGAVYCVLDERTGQTLALKRMHRAQSRDMLALFEREYRTLAGLQHPRIIRVYDYGVDGGEPFYTMELVQGRDLHELAPVPFADACRYLRDVATCLALLHTRRLLHRDVTPRNVRVTADGHCKLLDFGALTSFGIAERAVGTPPCMPPEAVRGAPLDQRADLFSFGALSYYMLTGRHAYRAHSVEELDQVWEKPPQPPSKFAPDIPKEADALVMNLLSLDPALRPATVAAVVERLNVLGVLPPEDEASQRALADSYLVQVQFVGRERELGTLRRDLAQLQQGEGCAVLIEGAHGVGRTRLLGELSLQAKLLGLPSVLVDAGMHRQPHGTALAILEQVLNVSPAALREAQAHRAILAQLDHGFAERLQDGSGPSEPVESGELRAELQEAMQAIIAAACQADRRLVVAVDNAEDADEASVALLAVLQRMSTELPLALFSSAHWRDEAAEPFARKLLRERSRRLELEPLMAHQTFELARSLFGDAPNLAHFAEWLHERAVGRPLHCMELVRSLHARGVIRYLEGLWVLPAAPPEDALALGLEELLAQRLVALSEPARRVAEVMAVYRDALSRARSIELARAEAEDPFVPLEELMRCEVLSESPEGFRFSHAALRDALLAAMSVERKRELHLRCGEQQLQQAQQTKQKLAFIAAGWHFLQAGEESRGADLLAGIACDALGVRFLLSDVQIAAPALEAALQVYDRQGRSLYERMPLLASLAQAGYYDARIWGERYGEPALAAVLELSGVTLAARLQPYVGKTLGLIAGLTGAWLRFSFRPRRQRRYSFKDLLVQLFGVATTLTGMHCAALDVAGAERVTAKLEPFTHLPERLTPAGIAQFCGVLKEIGRDNQAYAVEMCTRLLERFQSRKYYVSLAQEGRLLYIGGLWFARGAFEAFRDGRGALEAADALDRIGLKIYRLVASELRVMYHAHRGELKQAHRHQEQVDSLALQIGSASLVELWSPPSLIPAYMSAGDIVEMRRLADRLATLAQAYPWLGLYAELADAALEHVRRVGVNYQHAHSAHEVRRELADASMGRLREILSRHAPRSFIGWGATVGSYARFCNGLGHHLEARDLCRDALAHLGPEHRPYVAMFLDIELELAVAEAGVGDVDAGRQRLQELLSFHAPSDNPLTRGRLHDACARVAALASDWTAFREHIQEMSSWYRSTGTPALMARVAALAALEPRRSSAPPVAWQALAPATASADSNSVGRSHVREAGVDSGAATVERDEAPTVVAPSRTDLESVAVTIVQRERPKR